MSGRHDSLRLTSTSSVSVVSNLQCHTVLVSIGVELHHIEGSDFSTTLKVACHADKAQDQSRCSSASISSAMITFIQSAAAHLLVMNILACSRYMIQSSGGIRRPRSTCLTMLRAAKHMRCITLQRHLYRNAWLWLISMVLAYLFGRLVKALTISTTCYDSDDFICMHDQLGFQLSQLVHDCID